MASASDQPPPSYIHTVYDETFRAKQYLEPSIMSMANRPNLLGQLEFHSPRTDGSFAICIAGGTGVFVSQALYESIPAQRRPPLDTTLAGQSVELLTGGAMTSIGTTFLPFILTDAEGQRIRIILYALVLPKLFMGMFISQGSEFVAGQQWSDGPTFFFNFGNGRVRRVRGI